MRLRDWIERAQRSPRLRRNPLIRSGGGWLIRRLLHFGKHQWETKSYDVWTFLMIALRVVRPTSIVELGTGRSSSYLAEYAGKYGADLACIEQNRWFARRMRGALREGLLDPRVIHFVPLAGDGWYSERALTRVVPARPEMLFVDGPIGTEEGLGKGSRDIDRGRRWMSTNSRDARLILVDDVERQPQLALSRQLAREANLSGQCFLEYPTAHGHGVTAVAMRGRDLVRVQSACDVIGIETYEELPGAEPPNDSHQPVVQGADDPPHGIP